MLLLAGGVSVGSECGTCSVLQHGVIGGSEMPHYTASRDHDRPWQWLRVKEMRLRVLLTGQINWT
jgi:hypothetical protein